MFVDFLHRNSRLMNANGETIINDTGLAALTCIMARIPKKFSGREASIDGQ